MIIFANGCFDVLHPGHLDFLRQMHEEAEEFRVLSEPTEVIIGLNSDESVRRLKGEYRPYFNEEERRMMLLTTKYVTGVILFSEDTAVDLINNLRPDVYFKGFDYYGKPKTPEQMAVEAYGGRVEIAVPPIFPIRHTTEIGNDIYWQEYCRRRGIPSWMVITQRD